MRLSKDLIRQIADAIVENIERKGVAKVLVQKHAAAEQVGAIITGNMQEEDALNREVEKLLRSYESEIASGGMDYRKLFDLTKQKLAREKKMVL